MIAGNTPDESLEHCKYWAFISYSHKDVAWAQWLHRSIEKYRLPRQLVGRSGRDGSIPRKLFPIFLDREELAAAGSLTQRLRDALYSSRTLIVICSPAAVRSRWVDEEVRLYKSFGRGNRVLCLITEGEPNVSVAADNKVQECFPAALRAAVDADGQPADQPEEPLAADVRDEHGGTSAAKLRIIAGILDLSYDEIKQRERQRRRFRAFLAMALTLVTVSSIGGMWYWQEAKRHRQLTAQSVAAYTDLGHRELIAGNHTRAAVLLNEAYRLGGSDTRLRLLLAEALQTATLRGSTIEASDGEWRLVVLDPYGERLIAAGETPRPKIWDVPTGKLRAELVGHAARVEAAAFSPSGRELITAGGDRTVRLWDADTGHLLATLTEHPSVLTDLVVSPDGRWFVSLGADGSAVLWNLQARRRVTSLDSPYAIRPPGVFNRDGTRIATRGYVGDRLFVWDLQRAAAPVTIRVEASVRSFAFTPIGDLVVVGGRDGALRMHHADTAELVDPAVMPTFKTEAGPLAHVSFLADDGRLLVVSEGGAIQVWDLVRGRQLRNHDASLGKVRVADVRAGHVVLITQDPEPRVSVWDSDTGANVTLDLDGSPITGAALDPRRSRLITSSDGMLRTWDLSRRSGNLSLPGHRAMVNTVHFSPDGTRVITAGSEATATVWDVQTGGRLATLEAHDSAIYKARFFADGTRILTVDSDGDVRVWDGRDYTLQRSIPNLRDSKVEPSPASPVMLAFGLRTGVALSSVAGGVGPVWLDKPGVDLTAMGFSRDGRSLAVGNDDGTVALWDVRSGTLIQTLWGHSRKIASVAFSPDGSRLVTTSGDPHALVWSGRDGALVARLAGHVGSIVSAQFSPAGERVITGSDDWTAKLWEARTGRMMVSLDGHSSPIVAVAFSPDGALVATAGLDRVVHVWDSHTGRLARSLRHGGEVLTLDFSPTGSFLATGAKEEVAKIWDLRPETRSPYDIAAILADGTDWRLENGILTQAGRAARSRSFHGGRAIESKVHHADTRGGGIPLASPEETIAGFLETLERGDTDAAAAHVAPGAAPTLLRIHDQDSAELRSLADMFRGNHVRSTTYRQDRLAAFTEIEMERGLLTVWTLKEGEHWRLLDIRARPHPRLSHHDGAEKQHQEAIEEGNRK